MSRTLGSTPRRSRVGQQPDEHAIRCCHEDMADLPLANVVRYLSGPEMWSNGNGVGLHDALNHSRRIATQCFSFHDAKDDVLGIDHDADPLTGGSADAGFDNHLVKPVAADDVARILAQ